MFAVMKIYIHCIYLLMCLVALPSKLLGIEVLSISLAVDILRNF